MIEDIAAGRLTRKDIPAYAAAVGHGQNFGRFVDRTFVGANSAISFEELSASEKAGSVSSRQQLSARPNPMNRQTSIVQSNLSEMEQNRGGGSQQ